MTPVFEVANAILLAFNQIDELRYGSLRHHTVGEARRIKVRSIKVIRRPNDVEPHRNRVHNEPHAADAQCISRNQIRGLDGPAIDGHFGVAKALGLKLIAVATEQAMQRRSDAAVEPQIAHGIASDKKAITQDRPATKSGSAASDFK